MSHITNRQVVVLGVLLTGLGAMFSPLQGVAQPPQPSRSSDIDSPQLAETPQPLATPPASSDRTTRAIGTITGQGTVGNIAKFTAPNSIGNSVIFENGGKIGIGLTNPAGLLSVKSTASNVYPLYALNASAGNAILGSSNGGVGVYGLHSDTTGDFSAVLGETNSTSVNGVGVQGTVKSTAPGTSSAGVRGINNGTSSNGYGVYGTHAGGGIGVYGSSSSGNGVLGDSASGIGVHGRYTAASGTQPGVLGETSSTTSQAVGIQGVVTPTNPGASSAGVRGINNGTGPLGIGVYGSHAGGGYGVYGFAPSGNGVVGSSTSGYGLYGSSSSGYGAFASSSTNYGVYGSSSSNNGVYGSSSTGIGVKGSSTGSIGVSGTSSATSGAGVQGQGYVGVQGLTNGTNTNSQAVRGDNGNSNTNGYAGYFYGRVGMSANLNVSGDTSLNNLNVTGTTNTKGVNVVGNLNVTGTLTKGAGSFKIDHPLHPATEYLSHSFVESPDMMNIYNGNAITNANGRAIIIMPTYFSALNCNFRYTLTPIGAPAPNLYVAQEMKNNRWVIAGGKPGLKVSWQVTGIRNDVYARQHRIRVEETKTGDDRGRYLYPAGFGAGKDKQIGADPSRFAAR